MSAAAKPANGTHEEGPVSQTGQLVKRAIEAADLEGRVDRHPYGTLAAALGVGYVLGGGLFTPLTARLLGLGLRLAAVPVVQDELVALVESALGGKGAKKEG